VLLVEMSKILKGYLLHCVLSPLVQRASSPSQFNFSHLLPLLVPRHIQRICDLLDENNRHAKPCEGSLCFLEEVLSPCAALGVGGFFQWLGFGIDPNH